MTDKVVFPDSYITYIEQNRNALTNHFVTKIVMAFRYGTITIEGSLSKQDVRAIFQPDDPQLPQERPFKITIE